MKSTMVNIQHAVCRCRHDCHSHRQCYCLVLPPKCIVGSLVCSEVMQSLEVCFVNLRMEPGSGCGSVMEEKPTVFI